MSDHFDNPFPDTPITKFGVMVPGNSAVVKVYLVNNRMAVDVGWVQRDGTEADRNAAKPLIMAALKLLMPDHMTHTQVVDMGSFTDERRFQATMETFLGVNKNAGGGN